MAGDGEGEGGGVSVYEWRVDGLADGEEVWDEVTCSFVIWVGGLCIVRFLVVVLFIGNDCAGVSRHAWLR